jgi:hypothetical protein
MRALAFVIPGSLFTVLALSGDSSGAAAAARAPISVGSPCRAPDGATAAHLHYLRVSSIAPTKAAWRASTNVPLVADTATLVTVVSDSTLCAGALVAFNAIVLPDSAATEIELLRADTVYVAGHPRVRSGEWNMAYVFGSTFQVLGSYLH